MNKLKRKVNELVQNFRYAFRPGKPVLVLRLVLAMLRTSLLKQKRLRYVDFAIGYACNLTCCHCFASSLKRSHSREMIAKDYSRVAAECMEEGVVNFSFQGGEPLIHKQLGEFISACSPKKNLISVTTNGTLLTSETISRLKRYGVDILTVSLDSGIPEEHDEFRGKKGTFEKALSGIKLAKKSGLNVTIGTVVTHQTLHAEGITRLIELVKELKLLLYLILPVPAGKWMDQSDMMLTDDDLAYIFQLTYESPYIRTDLQANLGGYGCGAAKEILYLTPYGDVLVCPFLHATPGNIFSDSIKNIRNKAMRNPYFTNYHPSCLVSSDHDFVKRYLTKINSNDSFPVDWNKIFPS